jgi:AcrR family transcriptional regulator
MSLFDQNNNNLGPKEKLLQAAFKLFAENGYNGTSTRSLCKMADVNISPLLF